MANPFSLFAKHGTPVCVLIWDIDYFKRLTGVQGHLDDDVVLMSVGRTLTQQILSGDSAVRRDFAREAHEAKQTTWPPETGGHCQHHQLR